MIHDMIESRALLLHRHQGTGNIDITAHDVVKATNGFTLAAGQLLSAHDLEEITAALIGRPIHDDFIPETVLAISQKRLVWYRPPQEVTLNFNDTSCRAWMPTLVFIWELGSIKVVAVKCRTRPTKETPVFYAPVGNVYGDGSICTGTFEMPLFISLEGRREIEGFVDEGVNTHAGNVDSVKGISGIDELAAFYSKHEGQRFPSKLLVPMAGGKVLGDLL